MAVKHRIAIAGLVLFATSASAWALKVIDVDPTKPDKTDPGKIPGKPFDPDRGGPPPTYADEGGDAPDADHADDADDADQGTWADEGGDAPTADSADHGDIADDADLADTADYSPSGDHADVADHATDVAECAGGPWMGGACGDLRLDGRLGLGADPLADLDVAGPAWLGSLQVTADGAVGVGGSNEGIGLLRVHGTVDATGFSDRGGGAVQVTTIEGSACRGASTLAAGDPFTLLADGSVTTDDPGGRLWCKVPVPAGATLRRMICEVDGSADGSWWYRDWDSRVFRGVSIIPKSTFYPYYREILEGEVHWLVISDFTETPGSSFRGCTIEWRR